LKVREQFIGEDGEYFTDDFVYVSHGDLTRSHYSDEEPRCEIVANDHRDDGFARTEKALFTNPRITRQVVPVRMGP
jgi:hypothetical protein